MAVTKKWWESGVSDKEAIHEVFTVAPDGSGVCTFITRLLSLLIVPSYLPFSLALSQISSTTDQKLKVERISRNSIT